MPMTRTLGLIRAGCIGGVLWLGVATTGAADSGVKVDEVEAGVRVTWPISDAESGSAVFSLDPAKPLIESLGVAPAGGNATPVAAGLNPVMHLTVGSRDLKNPAGWVAFFDNPPQRPHQTHPVLVGKRRLVVSGDSSRTTVSVAEVSAASFRGDLRFTFYSKSPLIRAEAVVSTQEDGRAIVYDVGFAGVSPGWGAIDWNDTAGVPKEVALDPNSPATPLAVSGRAIAAESDGGALAVFPEPHRFFYPQDEAFNLQFVWHGRDYGGPSSGYGIGIRQSITGDKRFVPWFNAPPGTQQHLGVFLLLTRGDGRRALDAVAKYTRGDRFKALAGYRTFTSHYVSVPRSASSIARGEPSSLGHRHTRGMRWPTRNAMRRRKPSGGTPSVGRPQAGCRCGSSAGGTGSASRRSMSGGGRSLSATPGDPRPLRRSCR